MTEGTNPETDIEKALSEAEQSVALIPEIDRQIGILLARRQVAFEKAYGAFVEKAFDWQRVLGCRPSELIREWDEKGVESEKFRNAVTCVRNTFFPSDSPAVRYSFVGFSHDAYDHPLDFAFRRIGGNRFEKFMLRLLTKDSMQPAKARTLIRLPPSVHVLGATTGSFSSISCIDYGATASWKEARNDIRNYTRAADAADPSNDMFLLQLGSALRQQEQDRIMHGRNGCNLAQKAETYQTIIAAARNFDPCTLQTIENCLNIRPESDWRKLSIRNTFDDNEGLAWYEVITPRVPESAFRTAEEWAGMKLN